MEYRSGLRPFAHSQPIIELEFDNDEWIDLHNFGEFVGVTAHGAQLDLRFVQGREAITIVLDGISKLSLAQPEDWDPRDDARIEHWHVWPVADGAEEFEFLVGGYVITLAATGVDVIRGAAPDLSDHDAV